METLEILTVPAWFDKNELPTRVDDLDVIAYLLRRNAFDTADDAYNNCVHPKKVTFEVIIKMKVEKI
ncbi:MAG: hypothetical protein [Caudoviricetes sp.]|nr:MAG: hypothetical protein [Caudoviricetes sp.]